MPTGASPGTRMWTVTWRQTFPMKEHLLKARSLKEEQEGLWVRLGSIPGPAREMLVLRYLVGWKVNQIAAHLDIPENTVSVTMQRALDKLRAAWQPEDERK